VDIAARVAAFWLSVVSFSMGAGSLYLQSRFLPDFFAPDLLVAAGSLLLVGGGATGLWLRASSCTTPWPLTALAGGHLTAAIATRATLAIRPTCINLTESPDYWLPTNTGPLWLFGPGLAVLAACAVWQRFRP
jgi:hypothetical protein